MSDYHKYRISPDAAYGSFDIFDSAKFIVEPNGLAYETTIDGDLNEVAVLFSGVNKTKYLRSALRVYPKSYTSYEKGLKHGRTFEWWPNGKLQSQEFFIKGHTMGGKTRWNIDGTLKAQSEPDEQLVDENLRDGKRHGDYYEWWPNGKLRVSRSYVDGKEHQISREWHYNGLPPDECEQLALPYYRITVDISDDESIDQMFAGIDQLEGLVNAAGIVCPGPVQSLELSHWQEVIDINLTGTMLVSKQATNLMLVNDTPGSVVNISSIYGLTGGAGNVGYNVSKSGVRQLTGCKAADLGSKGIRVNSVCPGYIETPMTDMLKDASVFRDQFVAMHLLQRPGKPEEVTQAICFLLSDDASYITGAALPADGGFTAALVPVASL